MIFFLHKASLGQVRYQLLLTLWGKELESVLMVTSPTPGLAARLATPAVFDNFAKCITLFKNVQHAWGQQVLQEVRELSQ